MLEDIVIGKHTLEALTSGMYSDPFVLYREYIQNSADSIDMAVEAGLLKNRKDGEIRILLEPADDIITITDNGTGISSNEAEKALISIGNSKKTSDLNRGFRGIGRLAALSYCKRLHFKTTAYGEAIGTSIIIDAEALSNILGSRETDDVTVVDVLRQVYNISTFPVKEKDHYFTVEMEGIDTESKISSFSEVLEYLSQNVPVPFNPNEFAWGSEITKRLKKEGYEIRSYNISLSYLGKTIPIYKDYKDTFLVDKGRDLYDTIQDVEILHIYAQEKLAAIGWLGKINFFGSIYDKTVKGIRLRKGNILIGDQTTLNSAFKDPRFNGWSIGEIYAISQDLIPNARRDNFEKNYSYFSFNEQLTTIAAKITREIRAASLKRSNDLSKALERVENAKEIGNKALAEGIPSQKKGNVTHKLTKAKNELAKAEVKDDSERYYKEIAFEEIDKLLGKVKGATSYNNKVSFRREITRGG